MLIEQCYLSLEVVQRNDLIFLATETIFQVNLSIEVNSNPPRQQFSKNATRIGSGKSGIIQFLVKVFFSSAVSFAKKTTSMRKEMAAPSLP